MSLAPRRITLDDVIKSHCAFRGMLPDGVLFEINKILLPWTTSKVIFLIDIQPTPEDPKLVNIHHFGLHCGFSSAYPVPREAIRAALRNITSCTLISRDLYVWKTITPIPEHHYTSEGPGQTDEAAAAERLDYYIRKILMPKS